MFLPPLAHSGIYPCSDPGHFSLWLTEPTFWSLYRIPIYLGAILLLLLVILFLDFLKTRKNQHRLSRLAAALPARIASVNGDGYFLFLQIKDWFPGFPVRDMKHIFDMPDRLGERLEPVIREVLRSGRSVSREYTVGSYHRRAEFTRISDGIYGEPAVLWISFDIENEFVRREQLKLNNELLSLASKMANLAYFDGGASPEELFEKAENGFSFQRADGMDFFPLPWLTGESRHKFDAMKKAAASSPFPHGETELFWQDGELERYFNLRVNRYGERRYVLTVQDISVSRRTEQRLQEATVAAQAADRAKSYFLATMSHELRTPLNAIIGYSELLMLDHENESCLKRSLDTIHMAGNTLLSLVNEILDLSRLEAGQMEIVRHSTDLPLLVETVLRIFEPRRKEKKLELSSFIESGLPTMQLDEKRIRQVLLNLVGNAIKYTDSGGVALTVTFDVDDSKRKTGTLTFTVRDSGVGISEDAQKCIFRPFARSLASDAGNTKEGAGLGLPIAQRLVNCMGGEIELESHLGVGSLFTVRLPHVQYDTTFLDQKKRLCSPDALVPAKIDPLPPCHVMVVDDLELNLSVMVALLEHLGIKPVLCSSGEQALQELRERRPDILFSDLWMPEMSGEALAKKLKDTPETAKIPIIALTADMRLEVSWNMEYFNGVLFKPVELGELRRTIWKHVFAGKN